MKRFCKSLLAKYMSIILTALCLMFLLQIGHAFLGAALFKPGQEAALDRVKIEAAWLREAEQLQNPSPGQTQQHFQRWKQQYPKASMFWVDGEGLLAAQLNVEEQLPIRWTPAVTAQFMKRHTEGTAFTFVAFVGGDETQGFLVLDLPRIAFEPPLQILYQSYGPLLVLGVAVVVVLFIVISFLFFQSIRKRLVQLQEAMTMRDADRIPLPIDIQKQDEIGQLEQAFNEMVCQLRESKQREQAEEQLLALPVSKLQVYLAKFTVLSSLLLVSSCLLLLFAFAYGSFLGLGAVPYAALLTYSLYPFLASLPVLALQLWIATVSKNQGIPITTGIIGVLLTYSAYGLPDWMIWKWPTLMNEWEQPLVNVWLGIGVGCCLYLAGMLDFTRRDVK